MADLGFLPVVRRLLDATPPDGQRMLFSATLDNAVDVLVRRFLDQSGRARGRPAPAHPTAMVHHLLTVAPADRTAVVADSGRRQQPVADLHPDQARRTASSPASWLRRTSPPPSCTATWPRRPRAQPRLVRLRRGPCHWSPPTSPPAVSTWTASTWSSTPTRLPSTRPTCTGPAGPARAGASGVVITLQTPAQAGDVRALMRKAHVVPLAAAVHPAPRCCARSPGNPPGRPHPSLTPRLRHRKPPPRQPSPPAAAQPPPPPATKAGEDADPQPRVPGVWSAAWSAAGRCGKAGEVGRAAFDEGLGQLGQAQVPVPGVGPQQGECLVHVQAEPLGELALGLLDDHPAVQGALQLFVRVSPRRALRSCSRPMVATSASAWPTRTSSWLRSPGWPGTGSARR